MEIKTQEMIVSYVTKVLKTSDAITLDDLFEMAYIDLWMFSPCYVDKIVGDTFKQIKC